jgi:uncharacterized protein (DUF2062 family)
MSLFDNERLLQLAAQLCVVFAVSIILSSCTTLPRTPITTPMQISKTSNVEGQQPGGVH